jgi:transcriptional regulator with XRE-family HTH domain
MKLRDYLKKHNQTQDEFAKMVGVTRPLITQIISGRKNPSIKVLMKITELTDGEVTPVDLYNSDIKSTTKTKDPDMNKLKKIQRG